MMLPSKNFIGYAVTVTLLAVSLPCWLFLRGWYGHKVFMALIPAALLSGWLIFIVMAVVIWIERMFDLSSGIPQTYAESFFQFYPMFLLYGALIHYPLMFISIVASGSGFRSLKGYAGNLIVWPSTYPQPPIDLLILAVFCAALYQGYIQPIDLQRAILSVNDYLQWIGLPSPPVPTLENFNSSFLICAGVYTLMVVGVWGNDGILPAFDDGSRRFKPRKQKREKIVPTQIKQTADPASQELKHIFSRRHPQLAEMAKPAN